MHSGFVPLRVFSSFTMLEGAIEPKLIAKAARDRGFPAIAVWFGWHRMFGEKTFAVWIPDYLVAFLFGIVFQYFTIAPMRGLSFGKGVLAAVKAVCYKD